MFGYTDLTIGDGIDCLNKSSNNSGTESELSAEDKNEILQSMWFSCRASIDHLKDWQTAIDLGTFPTGKQDIFPWTQIIALCFQLFSMALELSH